MKSAVLLLGLTALLSGCIIFDKKSEAVTFHQLAAPATLPTRDGATLFVPRALIPSAIRRANIVLIDDTGWVRIEDAHRWIVLFPKPSAATSPRSPDWPLRRKRRPTITSCCC